MAYPTITNGQLDTDAPVDTDLMGSSGLKGRDDWNWTGATNGGAGIEPNVEAFVAALTSHSHDGTDGQGAQIDSPGIADDAVNQAAMLAAGAVTNAKLAANTLRGTNFADGAVTLAKLSGSMGQHVTGSQAYDDGNAPRNLPGLSPPQVDFVFEGDTTTIANPKGALGVICNPVGNEWFVVQVTASWIRFGIRADVVPLPGYGTWNVDCYIM